MPLALHQVEGFPRHLLAVPAGDLWRHLPGPTLFHIPGRRESPLFVSVLLHGNEDTGWQAVQEVLARAGGELPRALLLLVGNVAAARAGVRTLPSQADHNRVWPGAPGRESPESHVMAEVLEIARAAEPFASIDIHNNTGRNPLYACLTSLADDHLHAALPFGRTVVYFRRPLGVQSIAFAPICPAISLECGRVGETAGIAHAAGYLDALLALDRVPTRPVPAGDLDLMQTFAIVKVPPGATFSFDGSEADFRFRPDLDRLNFSQLPAGTGLGRLGTSGEKRLVIAPGDDFLDVEEYCDYRDGEIVLSQPAIPAMLTLDPDAIRLDSLCYLMHRIDRDGTRLDDG